MKNITIDEPIINTSECEKCVYAEIDYVDKANIYINCSRKGRRYFYGQCIPCSYKVKKEENNNE